MFHKFPMMVMALHAVLLLIPTASLDAQDAPQTSAQDVIGSSLVPGISPSAVSECNSGIIYDDGTPENGRGLSNPATVWYGQRFAPVPYPYRFSQVCVWWTRTGSDTSVTYNVELYDNDGSGGAPSTFLGSWGPFTANDVPQYPEGAWYDAPIDFSTLGVDFVFAEIEWHTDTDAGFYIGTDEGGGGIRAPGYYWWSSSPGWNNITSIAPDYEAMYIRANGSGRFNSGYYEETHSYFDYNAAWNFKAKKRASGGGAAMAKRGAVVTFDFLGGTLRVYRRVGPLQGVMEVCVDDVCQDINNHTVIPAWTVPVSFGPYPPGSSHTVSISRLPGRRPFPFWLDAIEVL